MLLQCGGAKNGPERSRDGKGHQVRRELKSRQRLILFSRRAATERLRFHFLHPRTLIYTSFLNQLLSVDHRPGELGQMKKEGMSAAGRGEIVAVLYREYREYQEPPSSLARRRV